MKNSPALVVDCPLDRETIDSILIIRRLRLFNLRSLIKNPSSVQEMLKTRGIIDNDQNIEVQELDEELKSQLAQLEMYDQSENIHLQELEDYLEILNRGS
jgi:hypothetical protein